MSTIAIHDLPRAAELDRRAMSAVKGGNGSWVFGWIQPYRRNPNPFGAGVVLNFYQINNYANQMINQVQNVDIHNTAANASINVGLNEASTNAKH